MFVPFIIPLTLLFNFLNSIHCFNVDTQFPIIFKSTFGENIETYFGLAVDMQKIENSIKFIIGAPKANSTLYPVKQSGTVFNCDITSETTTVCHEINIDFRRIRSLNRMTSKIQLKSTDNMFLGGTVVSKPNSNEVAACGHLWANELGYNTPNHQINPSGSCFVFDLQNTNAQPVGIFPLTDPNKQYEYSTYYYSHAMSGFSATFSQNGNDLFLGAPGFYQWRGSILETENFEFRSINNFVKENFLLHRNSGIEAESYFGYSLVSGHFLAGFQTSIATGAPRDFNYRGRVYIYNLENSHHSEETTSMHSSIGGTKLGEYFGASLLAVNINNDEYTDLIVGAPFFSSSGQFNGDKGRAYVYISNGKGFNEPQILIGSDSTNSRFGTSLADLGDINFDGYNDVAIGAPYEEDSGSIYIYHGGRNGIITPYAQRISSKQHFSGINLKGFGISISGNKDVDNNYYKDILIGSYLSNRAVLLRTKPIVNIKAEIRLDSDHINIEDRKCNSSSQSFGKRKLVPCVRMSYCIGYEGKYVPYTQKFDIKLQLDSRRPESARAFIQQQNQQITAITSTLTLDANADIKCFGQFIVYLLDKAYIDDVYNPIEFSLYYNLVSSQTANKFCSLCPIVSKNETITKQLHFETGCNSDEKCISDLKLAAKTLVNNILIGDTDSILEGFHKNLTLIVDISNFGEPSYLTKLLVNTKPTLNVLKQDIRCKLPKMNQEKDDKFNFIECDVGNPLENGSNQKINIPLDISQLDINTEKIEISLELKTASEITPGSQMNLNLTVNVGRNASLEIFGSSLKSVEIYESSQNRKSDFIPFSGLFQIVKQNSSTIENVLIEIEFPSIFEGRPLVFRPHIEIIRGVSVNCNRTISQLPVLPLKIIPSDKNTLLESSKLKAKNSANKRKRDVNQSDNEDNNKNTLTLDCNSKIACYKLQCYAGPFKQDKQIAQFILNSGINISSIESIYGKNYHTIKLILNSNAIILDKQLLGLDNYEFFTSTTITFKRLDLSVKPIEKWIIFISAGIGFLIFILIVIVLIKLGFFRRQKIEEMENMSNETNLKEDNEQKCLNNDLNNCDSSDDLDNEIKI